MCVLNINLEDYLSTIYCSTNKFVMINVKDTLEEFFNLYPYYYILYIQFFLFYYINIYFVIEKVLFFFLYNFVIMHNQNVSL